MIKVFVVYDELANLPMAVTLHQNDEVAKRSFVDLLTTPFTVVSDHPAHFKLLSFDLDESNASIVMRGIDFDSEVLESKKLSRLRMMHEAEDARLLKTMKDALKAINDSSIESVTDNSNPYK